MALVNVLARRSICLSVRITVLSIPIQALCGLLLLSYLRSGLRLLELLLLRGLDGLAWQGAWAARQSKHWE